MRYFYLAIIICFTISGNLFAQELMDAWDAVDAGREALLEAPAPPDGYAQSEYAQSNSAQSNEQLLSGWEAVDRGRAMERDHWQRTGYVPPTAANGWYQNPWDVVIWNAPSVQYYPSWQPQRVTVARLQLPPSYLYGSTEEYNRRVLAQIAARQAAERAQEATLQNNDMMDESIISTQPPVPEQVAAVVVLPSQSDTAQPQSDTATLKIETESGTTEAVIPATTTKDQQQTMENLSAQYLAVEQERIQQQERSRRVRNWTILGVLGSVPLLFVIGWSTKKILSEVRLLRQDRREFELWKLQRERERLEKAADRILDQKKE